MRFSTLGALALTCLALVAAPRAHALNVDKYPALRSFIADMADQHGYSDPQLRRVFRCARIRPEIIEAMERPKELLPWYEYRNIFLTEENVQRGVRFWKKHAAALTQAREQYGVAPGRGGSPSWGGKPGRGAPGAATSPWIRSPR